MPLFRPKSWTLLHRLKKICRSYEYALRHRLFVIGNLFQNELNRDVVEKNFADSNLEWIQKMHCLFFNQPSWKLTRFPKTWKSVVAWCNFFFRFTKFIFLVCCGNKRQKSFQSLVEKILTLPRKCQSVDEKSVLFHQFLLHLIRKYFHKWASAKVSAKHTTSHETQGIRNPFGHLTQSICFVNMEFVPLDSWSQRSCRYKVGNYPKWIFFSEKLSWFEKKSLSI